MGNKDIHHITPERLREYTNRHHESDYLLIDVRQPGEYQHAHIPGALLMPVMELESRLFSLPNDKDLLFYCHSGGRSLAAWASSLACGVGMRFGGASVALVGPGALPRPRC